jgi:cytochrome c556
MLVSACILGVLAWNSVARAVDPHPAMTKDSVNALIFERQQIMTQLNDNSELLGDIVAGLQAKEKLAATTRALAMGAKDSREAFNQELPGGRSKPEVWSNRADFMKRMETFVRETDALAKLGETGNIPAVTEKLVTALPCKECHDLYRAPKSPGQ